MYPPILGKGDPKRHQMVVYLHIISQKNAQDFDVEIRLDPEETDAYMWLNREQVQVATDYSTKLDKEKTLLVKELKNGILEDCLKSYDVLRADVVSTGSFDIERISTGTRFALEQYYAKTETNSKL